MNPRDRCVLMGALWIGVPLCVLVWLVIIVGPRPELLYIAAVIVLTAGAAFVGSLLALLHAAREEENDA